MSSSSESLKQQRRLINVAANWGAATGVFVLIWRA